MITIHTAMLVALGFLLATLLALALAPAYWARAVRLTRRNISRTMPMSEAEIRADKDRLRAEYAVRIHNLESTLEKARLAAARQQVEVSRRDANIGALEAELLQLRTDLEQNVNARRVLEQTVMDRLPSVEQRLADSRILLDQRDRELAAVSSETGKTVRALDEVMQINAQQRSEIERLNSVVSTRASRNRGNLRDTQFDGELALRSELEALRSRTRDQENLINRLQALVSDPAVASHGARHVNGADRTAEAELDRVRRDLSAAELALRSASEQALGGGVADELEARIKALNTTLGEKEATIRKLEAALAAYQQGEAGGNALKDSKIAMKARLGALQSDVDTQAETIQKLRAELAAANERAALQGAQFMEEMRRIGAGAYTQSRPTTAPPKRSVSERIGEAKPALASSIKSVTRRMGDQDASTSEDAVESMPVALNGAASDKPAAAANGVSVPAAEDGAVGAAAAIAVCPNPDSPQKPRLLDRLAGLSKP